MIAEPSHSVAARPTPFPSRSLVACKNCGAHFDLVPALAWPEDERDQPERQRTGACPVCGATRLYQGDDFFLVPGA